MIKQLSVFLENEPGRLVKVTKLLSEAKIDIRALTVAEIADFGILRLIVDDPDKAYKVLKDNIMAVSIDDVLGVKVDDRPGGLGTIAEILGEAGVNIEYIYAFITKSHEQAFVVMRVGNTEKAVEVLKNKDIRLVESDEVTQI